MIISRSDGYVLGEITHARWVGRGASVACRARVRVSGGCGAGEMSAQEKRCSYVSCDGLRCSYRYVSCDSLREDLLPINSQKLKGRRVEGFRDEGIWCISYRCVTD